MQCSQQAKTFLIPHWLAVPIKSLQAWTSFPCAPQTYLRALLFIRSKLLLALHRIPFAVAVAVMMDHEAQKVHSVQRQHA